MPIGNQPQLGGTKSQPGLSAVKAQPALSGGAAVLESVQLTGADGSYLTGADNKPLYGMVA